MINTWYYKIGRFKFYFRNHWWNFHVWVSEKKNAYHDYGKEYCLTFFIPHFIKKYLADR